MKYLSLDSLKTIYITLSTNTPTPETQGATQKVSAVRHLFAFYRYCVAHNTTVCDLKIKANRDEFVGYVCEIVKLDGDNYTANFHASIAELSDCRVSSNFFSAGVLPKSETNPALTLTYPANHPLFDVKNQILSHNAKLKDELSYYLTSDKIRMAFALWLVRDSQIDESNAFDNVASILESKYSKQLIEILFANKSAMSDALNNLNLDFSEQKVSLTTQMILDMFQQHTISNDQTDIVLGPFQRNTNGQGMNSFVWEVLKYFNELDHLKKMINSKFVRFPDKYVWMGSCPAAKLDQVKKDGAKFITLHDGRVISNDCNCDFNQFINFIGEFNLLYSGQYSIYIENKDGKDDKYYLKKIMNDSSILIQNSDPTEFVWSCIKLFNSRKELETLFASKYKSQGGSQGNYVKINNCYVAQEGQLLVDDVDNIQIFDGSYLNDNFDAREVDLFRDAINDVFAGKYEISISGDEGEEVYSLRELQSALEVADNYRSYIAALRTKPFMLLAGISGTGKSRIVREMAKACWSEGEEEFGKNRPKNFCMVQVKPNWHDSSELIGYISRINGEKFVVGPFLKFMARAIQDPSKPYFLCLDEMNLAPVEQYFAEYLSVIESRKVDDAGNIVTDPLIDYEDTEAYKTLIDQLFDDDDDRKAYLTKERGRRLTIPQNLFVIGTVNMDETTYSFSRKVLDRAMTIEMNEVNLDGGLDKDGAHEFTFIPTSAIVGKTVEGCDVYSNNSTLCDFVIKYLTKINAKLDGTPFKIAYRTRNEFLVYAVNRLLIAGDELSAEDKNRLVLSALDEMTSMKILSRIEGDETRTRTVLRELHTLLEDELKAKGIDSMSLLKIDEMLKKLDDTQYTSYWA